MSERTHVTPVLRALFVAVLTLMSLAAMPVLLAEDGGDLVEECYRMVGTDSMEDPRAKACRNIQALVFGAARACRSTAPSEECATIDGRLISEALVQAFEESWTANALALQRGLDDGLPLKKELWLHTHNSFNAEPYDPTLSGLDTNQTYSLTDQLRMGVRAIEIDVHWAPSAESEPGDGGKAPIVCHGRTDGSGPVRIHTGCTIEVHLRQRLQEVADWMTRPENAGEVIIVYLENQMEDDPTAHVRASEAIASTLGDLVYRPGSTGEACASLPVDLSRKEILASGQRVILTGNCGAAGVWRSWVFQRGAQWHEGSSPQGVDYPDYPDCIEAERQPRGYDDNWIRFYEDHTWLSAMATGSGFGRTSTIPPEEARRMVRCGVNMPGFDNLEPFDPRLEALVWSWAPEEPRVSSDGMCAFADAAGGFHSDGCNKPRRFSCLYGDGTWSITNARGLWRQGAARCARIGATFAVPRTGFENELLKTSKGSNEVWLNYRFESGLGWMPFSLSTEASPPHGRPKPRA